MRFADARAVPACRLHHLSPHLLAEKAQEANSPTTRWLPAPCSAPRRVRRLRQHPVCRPSIRCLRGRPPAMAHRRRAAPRRVAAWTPSLLAPWWVVVGSWESASAHPVWLLPPARQGLTLHQLLLAGRGRGPGPAPLLLCSVCLLFEAGAHPPPQPSHPSALLCSWTNAFRASQLVTWRPCSRRWPRWASPQTCCLAPCLAAPRASCPSKARARECGVQCAVRARVSCCCGLERQQARRSANAAAVQMAPLGCRCPCVLWACSLSTEE